MSEHGRISMAPHLRRTIDELVRLDRERRAQDTNGAQPSSPPIQPDAVEELLATLPKDDFIFIKALMHFGRGDDLGHDAPFSKFLDWTATGLNEQSVPYLAGKDLSEDLPAGLRKLGL